MFSQFHRGGFVAPIIGLTALTLTTTASAQSFDDAERAEIGEIVREYLLANPEVMLDVQNALEEQQLAAQTEQRKQIIDAASADLFRNVNDPVLGNPAGDVTIVEFFDYNCGFCRRAMDDMNAVIDADPNVRFVLKEFPILGEDSVQAHRVALAFNRLMPQAYPEFHERLMNHDGRAGEQSAMDVAIGLGADEAALRAEMEHPSINASIENTYELAEALGISGTPSYVVGSELVAGALGVAVLQQEIEEARTCAETAC